MSTLEERALADSDDSDRFVTSNHDYPAAIASFVDQTKALVKAQQERDEALAALARVRALLDAHDGAYWAVCGVREADIRAALEEPS